MAKASKKAWGGALALAAALMVVPATAVAAPGGGAGHGGGGSGGIGRGGGPGGETATNNLSVPAIFVGGNPYSLTCDGTYLLKPSGTPLSGYPINTSAYYYVQGQHKWQAQCKEAAANTVTATADWGDNLSGDAALKVGSPIRVEVGLLDDTAEGMTGYTVHKLDPNALDRESAYGTGAASGELNAAATEEGVSTETRVWDAGAKLTISDSAGTPLSGVTTSAEINATGRVVYGYNLRVSTPGQYTITFSAPNVTLSNAADGHTVSLPITVSTGGGGGGGGGGGPRR